MDISRSQNKIYDFGLLVYVGMHLNKIKIEILKNYLDNVRFGPTDVFEWVEIILIWTI